MRILIVEDETVAYENLVDILVSIEPDVEVVGNTESIFQTVEWLKRNPLPDLILMDIHLSDGLAFSVFERIKVETPVIFTTAYDEYAIEAFKVNSIDYLLKPIKAEELQRALAKFRKWTQSDLMHYFARYSQLSVEQKYIDKLLVPLKDKLLPVNLKDVSCFYTTDRNTYIYMKDGNIYPYSRTLEQIYSLLNPVDYCRANKQYIIARESVTNITVWFDSRLLITLDVDVPERIYISKNKAVEFKAWIVNGVH